ncbi:MAG: DUF2339 domain-containing protein, partial [Chloroflexota bacterium]
LLFVAVTLVGTTAIAVFRSWPWLPPIAFVLAAPQLASWLIGAADIAPALIALAGFWTVNIVAAAGEEVHIRRDDLRPSSATLVLANGTFLLWGLITVLDEGYRPWLGTAVATASLAHLLVGAWFLRRQGLAHLFGNLVAGTSVALLAVASFVQLGAPAVPVAWAAEAVALAWLAARRLHRWSALAGLVLGALAIGHLLVAEYPLVHFGIPADPIFLTPLLHPEAASMGAVLLALAVAALLVPMRPVRSAFIATGVVLVAYAASFEVAGSVLVAVLAATVVAAVAYDRALARTGTAEPLRPLANRAPFAWYAAAAALVPGLMALGVLFSTELPAKAIGVLVATPFFNQGCASLLIVLAGLAATGVLLPVRWLRSGLAGLAVLLIAWAIPFQVEGPARIGLLALLLPVAAVVDRGLARPGDKPSFAAAGALVPFADLATVAGAAVWSIASLEALATSLSPADWGRVLPPAIPFSDERALVGALLVASLLAAIRWLAAMPARRIAIVAAFVVAAWVVPFEVLADGVVLLWVLLAVGAVLVNRWDTAGGRIYDVVGLGLWASALVVALVVVAPPFRLWIDDPAYTGRGVLLPLWGSAFAALAAVAVLAPRHPRLTHWHVAALAGGGAIAFYALSVGVVDLFARRVGGGVAVEELAKQAQVALSVCWTAVGAALLLAGLVRRIPIARHAGFAVLGLATAKVVVIDMASMDVAYRALVLFGLGLLLLASAYGVTRFRGPRMGPDGLAGGAGTAA